jgi:hypothetical protein
MGRARSLPGGDEQGPRGLRREAAEGDRSVAVDTHQLLAGRGVEAGRAVGGNVGEEAEAGRHDGVGGGGEAEELGFRALEASVGWVCGIWELSWQGFSGLAVVVKRRCCCVGKCFRYCLFCLRMARARRVVLLVFRDVHRMRRDSCRRAYNVGGPMDCRRAHVRKGDELRCRADA